MNLFMKQNHKENRLVGVRGKRDGRESEKRSVIGSRIRKMLLLLLKIEGISTSQGVLVAS